MFGRLKEYGLKVKLAKCSFARREVHFLGHCVSDKGLRPDDDHVKVVRLWPVPKTVREVQSFIGLCSYFRRFVHRFSHIAEPLIALTRDNKQFVWDENCQRSFEELKLRLITAPILAFPRFDVPFIVSTDASNVAIGGMLEQIGYDGVKRVIAYFSKSLTAQQRNWHTSERECFAVVECIQHWHSYLSFSHFTVYCDHNALVSVFKEGSKLANGRLSRWQLLLQYYSFTLLHRPGSSNKVPDVLSRIVASLRSVSAKEDIELDSKLKDLMSGLRDAQQRDPELIPLLNFLSMGRLPSENSLKQDVLRRCNNAQIVDGILCTNPHTFKDVRDSLKEKFGVSPLRFVVPQSMKEDVINYFHSSVGGHMDSEKTYRKMIERFWWKGMWKDVRELVECCPICQQVKRSHQLAGGAPLQPIPVTGLFERIGIDFVGPLPTSIHGNSYMMVITDYLSKWSECYPLRDCTATAAAVCLADWCSRYGAPFHLVSDQGRQFTSDMVKEFCRIWGIHHHFTSSYHPQSDGQDERTNGTLEQMILSWIAETNDKVWDEGINSILFAYRTSVHSATGFSPAELVFGVELKTPVDAELIKFLADHRTTSNSPAFLVEHARTLMYAREMARRAIVKKQLEYAKRFDESHSASEFSVGDFVWLENMARSNKLGLRYLGPYRVHQRTGLTTYMIHDQRGRPHDKTVHVTHLKRVVIRSDLTMELPPVLSPSISSSRNDADKTSLLNREILDSSMSVSSPSVSSSVLGLDTNSFSMSSSSSSLFVHDLPLESVSSSSVIPVSVHADTDFSLRMEPCAFELPGHWVSGRSLENLSNVGEGDLHVARILGKRKFRQKLQYLVQWSDVAGASWESADSLTSTESLNRISEFERGEQVKAELKKEGPQRLLSLPSSASSPVVVSTKHNVGSSSSPISVSSSSSVSLSSSSPVRATKSFEILPARVLSFAQPVFLQRPSPMSLSHPLTVASNHAVALSNPSVHVSMPVSSLSSFTA